MTRMSCFIYHCAECHYAVCLGPEPVLLEKSLALSVTEEQKRNDKVLRAMSELDEFGDEKRRLDDEAKILLGWLLLRETDAG
jgi:hypothetical protein